MPSETLLAVFSTLAVWGCLNATSGEGLPSGSKGRWLRVDLPTTTGSAVLELVVYGTKQTTAAARDALSVSPPAPRTSFPPVALSLLLGVNVVGAVSEAANLTALAPWGAPVRIYSDWDWTEHVADQSAF